MSLLSSDLQDRQLFEKRFRLLAVASVIIFIVLIVRIGQWTILHNEKYSELARNNYIHPQRLEAPRGQIYSRDGKLIAVNRLTYSIWISPFRLTEYELHKTVVYLEETLSRDFSERERQALAMQPRWQWRLLARNLSLETIAPIIERQWALPGMRIISDFKRYYPEGEITSCVTGYLGRMTKTQIAQYREKGYSPDDLIGVAGIEKYYEDLLRGEPGTEVVQRDARGRYVDTLDTTSSVPGQDLYLSLDLDFQKYAYYMMEGKTGVAIAMNPNTGAILAMVSSPGYDSNDPAAPARPTRPVSYMNKAIQENYPPASTFKLVTAAAILDGGIRPNQTYACSGKYYLPNWRRPYVCELQSGHGDVNIRDALRVSCNVYFYQTVQKIGAKPLMEWSLRFGYGAATGVDLPYEVSGNLPIQQSDSILPGELLNLCIGQGVLTATPLQVLCSYCIFANEGRFVQPHFLLHHRDAENRRYDFQPKTRNATLRVEHTNIILEGLKGVVYMPGGTGFHAGFPKEWKVAGKTGTAERHGRENDAWFACYAPYDAPEIAMLVMIEEGGYGGSTSVPIAKKLMEYYFSNRKRFLE